MSSVWHNQFMLTSIIWHQPINTRVKSFQRTLTDIINSYQQTLNHINTHWLISLTHFNKHQVILTHIYMSWYESIWPDVSWNDKSYDLSFHWDYWVYMSHDLSFHMRESVGCSVLHQYHLIQHQVISAHIYISRYESIWLWCFLKWQVISTHQVISKTKSYWFISTRQVKTHIYVRVFCEASISAAICVTPLNHVNKYSWIDMNQSATLSMQHSMHISDTKFTCVLRDTFAYTCNAPTRPASVYMCIIM